MKRKLNDLMESDIKLVPDKGSSKLPEGVLARVKGIFSRIGVTNKNNRTYSNNLWEKVIDDSELQDRISRRMLVGEAEHPESTQSDIKRLAHVITSLTIDGNNVIGEADILDTPNGRIVNTLYRAGVPVGVSSRALGETSPEMDGVSEVLADSYEFMTFDSTIDPSFDAYPELLENVDFVAGLERAINEKRLDKVTGLRLLERMGEGCVKDSKCNLLLESMKTSLNETDEKDIQATTVYVPSADMNKEDADKAKKVVKESYGDEYIKSDIKKGLSKKAIIKKIQDRYSDINREDAEMIYNNVEAERDGGWSKIAKRNEKKAVPTCAKCGKKHWPFQKCPTAGDNKEPAEKEDDKKDESINKLKEAYPDIDSEDEEKRITVSQGNKGELASEEWKTNMKAEIARKKAEGIDLTPMEKTFVEINGMEESRVIKETGEMSQADIAEGGEDYEWANAIEIDVREIEKATNGKLKFIEMRPFDKYQGPYASVEIDGRPDKVWDAGVEGEQFLYLDNKEWFGDADTVASAINGDEAAIRQIEHDTKAARGEVVPDDFNPAQKEFSFPSERVKKIHEMKLEKEIDMKNKFKKLKESYPDIEDEEKRLVLSKGNVGEFGSEEWIGSMKAEIERKQGAAGEEGGDLEELTSLEKTFLEIEALKEEEALAPKPAEPVEVPAEVPLESKKRIKVYRKVNEMLPYSVSSPEDSEEQIQDDLNNLEGIENPTSSDLEQIKSLRKEVITQGFTQYFYDTDFKSAEDKELATKLGNAEDIYLKNKTSDNLANIERITLELVKRGYDEAEYVLNFYKDLGNKTKDVKEEKVSLKDQVKNQAELLLAFENTAGESKKTLEARFTDIKDLKTKLGTCGETAKTTIKEFKEEIVRVNKRYTDLVTEMTEAVKHNVVNMTKIIKEKTLSIAVIAEMKSKLEKMELRHYKENKLQEISGFYTSKNKAEALLERCKTKAGMDRIADLLRESVKKNKPMLHSKVDETLNDASLLESEDTVGKMIRGI